MTAYLTLVEFQLRTTMPPEYVTAIESIQPGWTLAQLEQASRWIDSRLRKRYAVPFDLTADPAPEAVKAWLTKLVTVQCYIRRGVDPTDQQFALIQQDAADAKAEIKEAADSNEGLFDLPWRDSEKATGISLGGPRVYSESSPYVWSNVQRTNAYNEDNNGSGSR